MRPFVLIVVLMLFPRHCVFRVSGLRIDAIKHKSYRPLASGIQSPQTPTTTSGKNGPTKRVSSRNSFALYNQPQYELSQSYYTSSSAGVARKLKPPININLVPGIITSTASFRNNRLVISARHMHSDTAAAVAPAPEIGLAAAAEAAAGRNPNIQDLYEKEPVASTTTVTAESEVNDGTAVPYRTPVRVITTQADAWEAIQILESHPDKVWACDTEVADIDVKTVGPVGNGKVTCVSIYGGNDVDFGGGSTALWVENIGDSAEGLLQEFKSWFENPSYKKVWHNYGFDRHVMYNEGIDCKGFAGDTMHMARLWNTARDKVSSVNGGGGGTSEGYSLESLTQTFYADDSRFIKTSMKELFGVGKLKKDGTESKIKELPPIRELQFNPKYRDDWIEYSARDAVATWWVREELVKNLKLMPWVVLGNKRLGNMFDFYQEYLKDFGELLTDMERNGIKVDTKNHLKNAERSARAERNRLEGLFRDWAAEYCEDAKYINIASPTQMAQLLFGEYDCHELVAREKLFKIDKSEEEIEFETQEILSANPYADKTAPQLKVLLKERGLKCSGSKLDLSQRLLEYDARLMETIAEYTNNAYLLEDLCTQRGLDLTDVDCSNVEQLAVEWLRSEYAAADASEKKLKRELKKQERELLVAVQTAERQFEAHRQVLLAANASIGQAVTAELAAAKQLTQAIEIRNKALQRAMECKSALHNTREMLTSDDAIELDDGTAASAPTAPTADVVVAESPRSRRRINPRKGIVVRQLQADDAATAEQQAEAAVAAAESELDNKKSVVLDARQAEALAIAELQPLREELLDLQQQLMQLRDRTAGCGGVVAEGGDATADVAAPDSSSSSIGSSTQSMTHMQLGTLTMPKRFREINIRTIGLNPTEFTPTGTARVSAAVLKKLAGNNVFSDDESEIQWGSAYKFFSSGMDSDSHLDDSSSSGDRRRGRRKSRDNTEVARRACRALGALAMVGQIDATINNFLVPLQALVDKNSRIHCSLNLNTETGRLSSRRPNLQNQPALEKDQYKIRDAFVAEEGKTLIVADYGQLELRLLAAISNCKSMIDAFTEGGCFHSRTAMGMYDYIRKAVDNKEVLLEWDYSKGQPTVSLVKDTYASERRKAKTLNFSIAYGKTVHGLAQDWGISKEEAQETLDAWYRDRPEVQEWQDKTRKSARRNKYVTTMMGRYRRLPDAAQDGAAAGHALRAAINTPIQGSAADVVMMAMLRLWRSERLRDLGWKLLLQIHDEVILEGPKESVDQAMAEVRKCMENPYDGRGLEKLSVHLDVDAKSADSWYKAK